MPAIAALTLAGLGLLGLGPPPTLAAAATPGGAGSGLDLVISSPTVTGACATSAGKCTSLTLPTRGPLPSTFVTPTATMVLTNLGSTAVTEGALSMSATVNGPSGSALEQGVDVCIRSGGTVVVNGPLARGLALTPSVVLPGPTLGTGQSNQLQVSSYAGEDSACGAVVSTDPKDAATWSRPPGGPAPSRVGTGTYVTPPSLDNPAEGGSVTVTIAVDLAATVTGPVTAGSTETGPGAGSSSGGPTSGGASTVPVRSATRATSAGSLAFTGFDVLAVGGSGALLLLLGLGLLAWRRRPDARR